MPGFGSRIFPVGLAAIMVAGCSSYSSAPQLTADPCADLTSVISEYPNQFADLRGSRSDFNSVTLYRAKKDIVKGHCEIWEWASGDTAYVCSLNAPDEQVAEQRYQQTVDYVANCLGSAWEAESADRVRDGEIAGVVTRYRNPDYDNLVVSIHNVAITGTGRASRSNYVFIGSAGRSSQL